MKNVYTTLGFALSASAASLLPRDQCCFSLTASGGKSGVVGQLGDGQNRIGQTAGLANGQGTYCLSNGGLTDGNGRGCILTPPTTQFQCDVGASPTTGFAVNSNGDLTYNGNTQFYACATGDNGGYNIYTTTSSAETGCVPITLNTGGKCAGNGNGGGSSAPASSKASQASSMAPPPASSMAPPPPTGETVTVYTTYYSTVTSCPNTGAGGMPSAPASMPPPASAAPSGTSGNGKGSACQTSLTGAYQTPHAIIPINKDQPSTSYGTQYNAYLSSSNSTIFNFDIPSSYSGKQCSVIFLFPKKADLQTSDFTLAGSGGIKFDLLASAAPLGVSYATCPAVKSSLGQIDSVTPGNSYVVSSGACQAGSTISIAASVTGSLSLTYFEDWNPSPIGLFITSC